MKQSVKACCVRCGLVVGLRKFWRRSCTGLVVVQLVVVQLSEIGYPINYLSDIRNRIIRYPICISDNFTRSAPLIQAHCNKGTVYCNFVPIVLMYIFTLY